MTLAEALEAMARPESKASLCGYELTVNGETVTLADDDEFDIAWDAMDAVYGNSDTVIRLAT